MEDIKKEVEHSNLQTALEMLLRQIELNDGNSIREINSLKSDISLLKSKVRKLESINQSLLKERNIQLIRDCSARLVNMIDLDQLEDFQNLIEEHEYPINEFITEEFDDLSHMNMLHYTIQAGKYDFATYLIERGADLNIVDKEDRWTPLMYAAQKQNLKMIHLLIERGANPNYKDIDGFTPLSVAVDTGNKEVVEAVLKAKPEVDNPKEILSMADPYENKEIIDLLKNYFGFQLILYDNNNSK